MALVSSPARRRGWRRAAAVIALSVSVLASAGSGAPQRGFGQRGRSVGINPWMYDGAYVFCRLAYRGAPDGDGSSWSVDYPKADLNFPFRLGQLTATPISRDHRGEPNHVVVTPTDPHLFECPFVMITEPAAAYFDPEEAAKLREYLDKGGFIWADDFWGEYAWFAWQRQLRKILPETEFPIFDVPASHMIRNIDFVIKDIPQVPSIDFWFRSGYRTSERADSGTPHMRAIQNARGHIIVFMTHNTDLGDAFEREGENREFFNEFAARGYAVGINVFLYAMTH